MSINYPKSPSERHLREHTHSLLFWSGGVLAVVGLVAIVCGLFNQPQLASNPLTPTNPAMLMPPS
jgi:hypothetical protein